MGLKIRRIRSKKGVFFSTDALIALIIIMLSILVIYPITQHRQHESEVPKDVLKVLSVLKVSDINNSYTEQLKSQGKIYPSNKSVLEQIGEFYVTNITLARGLAESILSAIETNENIGLWFGTTFIASRNNTPIETSKDISVERQIVSGISGENEGESSTGFSARAYLTSAMHKKYFYFGGYVGDGNISININYTGDLTDIGLEIAPSRQFQVYINGQFSGIYSNSSSPFAPAEYDLSAYKHNFNSGSNNIRFVGIGGNLYIAGGFIKITYEDSAQYEHSTKYSFPGVSGLVNIYDGFYVPGTLTNMEISLHYNSDYIMFLNIGNITVFNESHSGNTTKFLDNALLGSNLNYNSLSNKTTPLRISLLNVTYISSETNEADVFSITDLSGSMDGIKLTNAKNATKVLINAILNISGNRVGLIGYDTFAKKQDYHTLSTDKESLNNTIYNIWNAGDYTCICCGILRILNCFESRVLEENFNGQQIGANPEGWVISESGGSVDVTSNSLEGDRAVVVSRTGSSNPSLTHIFPAQQNNISIEFLINHTSGAGRMRLDIEGAEGLSSYPDYIILKMYNNQIYNNNIPIIAYSLNSTYKIKVQLIPGSSAYNLYINDALVGAELPVYSTRTNIGRISFTTESSTIQYIIDNATIFLNENLCSNLDGRVMSAIVMSDGQANKECGLDPVPDYDGDSDTTGDAQDQAIEAACLAHNLYNITIHTVGFGGGAEETTLRGIANCGNGSYYFSDIENIAEVYRQIAQDIIRAQYKEQTIESSKSVLTNLYPDSYIKFDYAKESLPYGLITTSEKRFDNEYSGSVYIPSDAKLIEAKVVSYSGPKWTNDVKINNNLFYQLSKYGEDYTKLGDPYVINIPPSLIPAGANTINITTGVSPTNTSSGSSYNKIIYTLVKNISSYSPIVGFDRGCGWEVEFEDNTTTSVNIPADYSGTDTCYYEKEKRYCIVEGAQKLCEETNDAVIIAAYRLFKQLDMDSNSKLEVKFTEQDLQIDFTEITGIPYTWSSEAQVRRWD